MSEAESALRVLQVHTRYRLAGGEDQVVEAERQLLAEAGGDVHQVIFGLGLVVMRIVPKRPATP